jgi:uncharacterized protein
MQKSNSLRRFFLKSAATVGGLFAANRAFAHHTESHFEDSSSHKIVYQCNKSDTDYQSSILFSVSELLRKYGDDVELVVAAFGPGVHILAKHPVRPVEDSVRDKVQSLAAYGVAFHACGNTMNAVNYTEADMLPFAKVVPIGVDDIMLLQERGFAYLSW